VERVVAHRVVAGPGGAPRMLYKVRWAGAGPAEDEWFPREDLVADFPAAVAEYEGGVLRGGGGRGGGGGGGGDAGL